MEKKDALLALDEIAKETTSLKALSKLTGLNERILGTYYAQGNAQKLTGILTNAIRRHVGNVLPLLEVRKVATNIIRNLEPASKEDASTEKVVKATKSKKEEASEEETTD